MGGVGAGGLGWPGEPGRAASRRLSPDPAVRPPPSPSPQPLCARLQNGVELNLSTAVNAAVLAATAWVVWKDAYGPWVTVGALHATAVSALGLGTTLVNKGLA